MATTDWLGALLQAVGQGGSTYYNVKQQEKDRAIEAEQRAQAKAERDRQFAAQDRAFKQSQDQFDYGRAKDIYESSTPDQNFADSPDTLALLTKAGLPLNKRLEHTPGTATGPMALPGQSVGLSAPPPPIGKQNDEFAPAPGPTAPPPGPMMSPVGGMTLGSVKDTATRPKTLKELAMEQIATAYADKGGKMDPMLRIFAANNGVTLPTDRVPQRLGIVPDTSFASGYALVREDPDNPGEEIRTESMAPASAGPSDGATSFARSASAALNREVKPGDVLTPAELRQVDAYEKQTRGTPQQPDRGISDYQRGNLETSIGGQVDRVTRDSRTAVQQSNVAKAGYERYKAAVAKGQPQGPASQAMIMAFGKVLDPGSVVRESEYNRSAEMQSMFNRFDAYVNRVANGGILAQPEVEELMRTVDSVSESYQQNQLGYLQRAKARAEGSGINLATILTPDQIDFVDEAAARSALKSREAGSVATINGKNYVKLSNGTVVRR